MSDIEVSELARMVKAPVDVLMRQLKQAGIEVSSPEDKITDAQKLLEGMRREIKMSTDPRVAIEKMAPLADRLRPGALSEVIGQEQVLGPDSPLGVMLASGALSSLIFWGPPGVGKTTDAMFNEQTGELHPDQFTWKEQESFMDQYGGQHRVVIDDVRGITPIGMLLDLLEFKPVIANQKNSGTAFQGIDIYLTSNYHPDEWYPDPKDAVALAALKGRFHYVTHYTEGHRLRYERGSRAFCSLMRLQYIE